MKKVLVFGTFDIFHKGHRNFLKQAREHGDFLRAVVARNETVLKVKGRLPLNDENERIKEVEKSGLADEVVLGNLKNKYRVVLDFMPDVICLGYDQYPTEEELEKKLREMNLNVEIVRLKPHESQKYKSSILRKQLENKKRSK